MERSLRLEFHQRDDTDGMRSLFVDVPYCFLGLAVDTNTAFVSDLGGTNFTHFLNGNVPELTAIPRPVRQISSF